MSSGINVRPSCRPAPAWGFPPLGPQPSVLPGGPLVLVPTQVLAVLLQAGLVNLPDLDLDQVIQVMVNLAVALLHARQVHLGTRGAGR